MLIWPGGTAGNASRKQEAQLLKNPKYPPALPPMPPGACFPAEGTYFMDKMQCNQDRES